VSKFSPMMLPAPEARSVGQLAPRCLPTLSHRFWWALSPAARDWRSAASQIHLPPQREAVWRGAAGAAGVARSWPSGSRGAALSWAAEGLPSSRFSCSCLLTNADFCVGKGAILGGEIQVFGSLIFESRVNTLQVRATTCCLPYLGERSWFSQLISGLTRRMM